MASALAAAFTPDAGAAASDSISPNMANDRLRDHDYDANMASLGGRLSRFEQIFPRSARVSVLFGQNLPLLWCLI